MPAKPARRSPPSRARAVQQLFVSTEQQGRTLIRLTVDGERSATDPGQPVRGYRRVEWIERALAPARHTLGKRRFERLVSALSMVIGWEALVVARDIRALSQEEAEDVSSWAARALVRAAIEDAEHASGSKTSNAKIAKRASAKRGRGPRRGHDPAPPG